MVIYGVALLSFCMLIGVWVGDVLGEILGVQANVGGVGIAMLLLLILSNLGSRGLALGPVTEKGLNFWSAMPEGQTWELAEFEAYGTGYALDASYATEIIDVGTDPPRFRRYFDDSDPLIPDRPVTFESFHTTDADDDGHIEPEERAEGKASVQFDTELIGRPVTWGRGDQ